MNSILVTKNEDQELIRNLITQVSDLKNLTIQSKNLKCNDINLSGTISTSVNMIQLTMFEMQKKSEEMFSSIKYYMELITLLKDQLWKDEMYVEKQRVINESIGDIATRLLHVLLASINKSQTTSLTDMQGNPIYKTIEDKLLNCIDVIKKISEDIKNTK